VKLMIIDDGKDILIDLKGIAKPFWLEGAANRIKNFISLAEKAV